MILETAVEILSEFGLADLTMRRLARQLEVAPGALYWHFPSKQELLGGIADMLVSGVDQHKDNLTDYCVALFTAVTSLSSGAEITMAASASNTLKDDPAQHLPAHLWHYVMGAAMDFQAREEAAQRLGIAAPDAVDVSDGVKLLLAKD